MKGFTLIELIYVILIFAILSVVGFEYIPNETLNSDFQVLKNEIMKKKSNAMGYYYTGENNLTCLEFNTTWLNDAVKSSSDKIHYVYKSKIGVKGLKNSDNMVCFDYYGRPYDGNVTEELTNLLHTNIIITLQYRNEEKNMTLYPISGFVR